VYSIKTDRPILITGAVGFIGFHLSRALISKGLSVAGFDNLNEYYDVSLKGARLAILNREPAFSFARGDLSDQTSIDELFKEYKPEIVLNMAAQAGVRYSIEKPGAYIDSNIVGFFNILEACRTYPVKHLIYASSSSVYGNQQKTPFSVEDSVDRPISLYAATKKSNELMAFTYSHLYGIPTTGLRFFTVYGPYGRPDMAVYKFTKNIIEGKPIQVYNSGDMYRDFTYVDDIVKGIENMLFSPPAPGENGNSYKLYNIGNNNPVRLSRFIEILEENIGKKAVIEYLPMQPGDVYQTYADVTPLMEDFGFKPNTPIEAGLGQFVKWYRSHYSI
jgi:UDP-glucuronate 4-epimerase